MSFSMNQNFENKTRQNDKKISRKEARIEELVRVATAVFAEKGYDKATVDEIAEATGIAKGTVYYHFKSKEELYTGIIKWGIEQLMLIVTEGTAQIHDLKELIGAMIEAQITFHHRYEQLTYLIVRELYGANSEIRSMTISLVRNYINFLYTLLKPYISTGKVKDLDPLILSTSIFGMISSCALKYLNEGKKIDRELILNTLSELILHGIESNG